MARPGLLPTRSSFPEPPGPSFSHVLKCHASKRARGFYRGAPGPWPLAPPREAKQAGGHDDPRRLKLRPAGNPQHRWLKLLARW